MTLFYVYINNPIKYLGLDSRAKAMVWYGGGGGRALGPG